MTKHFVHPGLLHTEDDFNRMKKAIHNGNSTVKEGWKKLTSSRYSAADQEPRATGYIYRGKTSWMQDQGIQENYHLLYHDAASAYALAIRWKITGDKKYAKTATTILDAWAKHLKGIGGSGDKFLAAGLYGYQLANAAEILSGYRCWRGVGAFKNFLLDVFYPMNHDFLINHNGWGNGAAHYWANWDLSQLASMISIGIFTNRRDIFDEAIDYINNGNGNGAFKNTFWKVHEKEGLAQNQESGRDQGHSVLTLGLTGIICQMAFHQGEDLFAFDDNLVLKGAEYVAKFNLGHNVPYTEYSNDEVTHPVISEVARGIRRPIWEMFYNHYVVFRGLDAPYIREYATNLRPEGGGGHYESSSGGYDILGYGTLLYTLK